jgi:hypothetical protein
MQFFILTFVVGFVCGKLHNFWITNKKTDAEIVRLQVEYRQEKERIRSFMESQMLVEFGLGGCCSVAEAAEAIRNLREGKPLPYPPPYPAASESATS